MDTACTYRVHCVHVVCTLCEHFGYSVRTSCERYVYSVDALCVLSVFLLRASSVNTVGALCVLACTPCPYSVLHDGLLAIYQVYNNSKHSKSVQVSSK